MNIRQLATASALVIAAAGTILWVASPAAGDAAADRAMEKALAKGEELWNKQWRSGAKSCAACHTRGPNKMVGTRLDTYPKYDKALRKVVSAQQKLNQMIKKKAGGKALELGSEDLTALEAYVASIE